MSRLLTFQSPDGSSRPGLLREGEVIDLVALAEASGLERPTDAMVLIRHPEQLQELLAALDRSIPENASKALAEVQLLPPVRPGKIVGVGLNYVEHVAESSRTLDTDKDLPTRPVLFSKPSTAVVGHGQAIRHDASLTSQLDWECELAVVIGRTASRVKASEALDYVFGYSIINDISARDQRRSGQWFFSKGQDSYAPLGPWIVTADEFDDPQALDFRLTVNGIEKQNSNTRNMLFSIATLIEDISSGVTLEPGDIIATGSAQGVGAGMTPPQFLQPGDVVELSIQGIGTLTNPVVSV